MKKPIVAAISLLLILFSFQVVSAANVITEAYMDVMPYQHVEEIVPCPFDISLDAEGTQAEIILHPELLDWDYIAVQVADISFASHIKVEENKILPAESKPILYFQEYDQSEEDAVKLNVNKDKVKSFTVSPLTLYTDYQVLITLRSGDITKELFTAFQPMHTRKLEPTLGIGETVQQTHRASESAKYVHTQNQLKSISDAQYFEYTATDYGTLNIYLSGVASGNDFNVQLYDADQNTLLRTSANSGNSSELIQMPVQKDVTYIIKVYAKKMAATTKTYALSITLNPFPSMASAVAFFRPISTACLISAYTDIDYTAGIDHCEDVFGMVEALDENEPASDPYNWPDERAYDQHKATDYGGSSSIYSAAAGTVIYAGNHGDGNGNVVKIQHADGYVTWYCHLSYIAVNVGDTLAAVSYLGASGNSGMPDGPIHLHFVVYLNSSYICPFVNGLLPNY